jgi:predicted lipoprotein with Yx(FWY)xxD motif
MKRYLAALIALVALAGATSAAAAPTKGTTIRLEKTSAGMMLTANNGFTLYMFSRDRRNRDACVHISGCPSIWPAVTTKAKPVATRGVNAKLLGTITLPNGSRQVTYAGHPLYRYSGDFGPRQTDYVGITLSGGTWHAVDAKGHRLG